MAEETPTAERAKKVVEDAQTAASETAGTMLGAARKVLLAGVGAVALTKDEVEDFVGKLVERGEIAQEDGRKLVRDVWARRRTDTEKVGEQVGDQFVKAEAVLDERVEGILTRLNVPTKTDIDTLSRKISDLSAKVDALKQS
jgi:poly(hydroxyalkanoate) granule-associated protein